MYHLSSTQATLKSSKQDRSTNESFSLFFILFHSGRLEANQSFPINLLSASVRSLFELMIFQAIKLRSGSRTEHYFGYSTRCEWNES